MNLFFNKDILGILFDNLEDNIDFLLFIKKNNIKVKEGINWEEFNWELICKNEILTEEFMYEFSDYLDWSLLSEHQVLTEEFMSENYEDLDWELLCYEQNMSDEFIIKHKEYIDWEALLDSCCMRERKLLSENVLRNCYKHLNKFCWDCILEEDWELTEEFIADFIKYMAVDLLSFDICFNGNISEEFIEKYIRKLNISILLQHYPESDATFLEIYKN